MFAVAAMLIQACNGLDPKEVKSKYHEKNEELNELYFDKVCGEWYNVEDSSTWRYYENLVLTPNHECTYTQKFESRSIVKVNGVDTYTDWETSWDYTQTGGEWKLCYSNHNDGAAPYLRLDFNHLTEYKLFYGADDNNLYVQTFRFDNLKRRQQEPGS